MTSVTARSEHRSQQRSTARELLKHPFITRARSTSRLVELVDRYQAHKARHPSKSSSPSKTLNKQAAGMGDTMLANETIRSEWNFDDTIRGTVKGMPVELDLEEMSDDDEWDLKNQEVDVEEGSAWGTSRVRHSGVMAGSVKNVSIYAQRRPS